MSIDFCARRISAAIGEIVRTEGLPSVLQDALVELRLPNVVALKELVAEVLRCPERVCDTLIAIAVTIERHKYLRAAVLKRIKMTASDRAAFKALFKPVLFVSIRLDTAREPHFFWMDEPRSPASMPSNWQASFPTDLIHSIPLMGRAFLDSLVQGDPDRVYVAIDMTPDRAAYWTELLKQRIAGGLTRHSLNEMKPYMNGVRVSKEQIQALKEASEKGQEKAYVFEMPYYHIVIRWCIPCDIVQDTRLPDITQIDTLVIQDYDLRECSLPGCKTCQHLLSCVCGMRYCCKEHQLTDWTGHKEICKLVAENRGKLERSVHKHFSGCFRVLKDKGNGDLIVTF